MFRTLQIATAILSYNESIVPEVAGIIGDYVAASEEQDKKDMEELHESIQETLKKIQSIAHPTNSYVHQITDLLLKQDELEWNTLVVTAMERMETRGWRYPKSSFYLRQYYVAVQGIIFKTNSLVNAVKKFNGRVKVEPIKKFDIPEILPNSCANHQIF